MPSSLPSSLASSRRPSKAFADARRSGSPVGDLMARARDQARMDSIIERAHELDQPGAAGTKREAEMSLEELAQTVQPTDGGAASAEAPVSEAMSVGCVATAASAPEAFESVSTNELSGKQLHPLRQLWLDAAQDKKNPLEHVVEDRGTWKGDWPLPTRSERQAMTATGSVWPRGLQEALAVQTARKEYKWKDIPEAHHQAFREAAESGWNVWLDNQAVEILPLDVSRKIRRQLEAMGQKHRIMAPRYVYTDKHDGLRTKENNLPVKPSARLVVPGYKDLTSYSLRLDAPTGTRTSVHLLLILTSSKKWYLMSADVKSAFLKGEEFKDGERILYIENVRVGSYEKEFLDWPTIREDGTCACTRV